MKKGTGKPVAAAVSVEQAKQAQLNRQKKKGNGSWETITTYAVYGILGSLLLAGIIAVMIPNGRKLSESVLDAKEITSQNSANHSFTVGPNKFFEGLTLSDTQKLWMNQLSHKQSLMTCPSSSDQNIIDISYNFREKYPECARPIQNQGNQCSSSYSVAAVSAVSDRLCLTSNGDFLGNLSAQPPISCYEKDSYACDGGFVSKTFQRGKTTGFVDEQCVPFTKNDSKASCGNIAKCQKVKIFDYCITASAEKIKREIMLNGPVVALVIVHADFLTYKSGIYRILEQTTPLRGTQAVKIIGWDTLELTNEQYWIIENSWGESWGQNGLAWIEMNPELLVQDYALAPITQEQADSIQAANASVNNAASASQQDLNFD